MGNLAVLRAAAGNVVGARLLLQRAAAAAEKVLGPRHSKTIELRRTLASLGRR